MFTIKEDLMKRVQEYIYSTYDGLKTLLTWSYGIVFILSYIFFSWQSNPEKLYGYETAYQGVALLIIALLSPIGFIQVMWASAKLLKGFSLMSNIVERIVVSAVLGILTMVGIWQVFSFNAGFISGLILFAVVLAVTDYLSQRYYTREYTSLENPAQYFVTVVVAVIIDCIAGAAFLSSIRYISLPPTTTDIAGWISPVGYLSVLSFGMAGVWSTYIAILNMWGSRTEFFMASVTPLSRTIISLTIGAITGILVYWYDYSAVVGILTGSIVGASLVLVSHERWQRKLDSLL